MKTLRRTCAAITLTLALAVSVLAGQIECPGVVSPGGTTPNITTTIILTVVSVAYP